MTPEEKEDAVLTWLSLQEAEELEATYQVISLDCPGDKKGKKSALLKFLLKHLCDRESGEDKGLATMLRLYDHVESQSEEKSKLSGEIKSVG